MVSDELVKNTDYEHREQTFKKTFGNEGDVAGSVSSVHQKVIGLESKVPKTIRFIKEWWGFGTSTT